MQHYYEMKRIDHGSGLVVIVDRTYEHCSVRSMFDDTCHDIEDLERKVNDGTYEWFILRARVLIDGIVLGDHTLGACMYEDPMEVFEDGTADDCIYAAMEEMKKTVSSLKVSLAKIGQLA